MIDTTIKRVPLEEYQDTAIRCFSSITYNAEMKRWELYSFNTASIFFADLDVFIEKLQAANRDQIQPHKEKIVRALEAYKKVMESE